MRAVSVTICRDRRPGSTIAPLQPLPDDEWLRFRADTLAAMEDLPGRETERRTGHTVWDGRQEECLTISRTWVTATDEQMATLRDRLAVLAAASDQDAVVLHDEVRHLITT